jgi:nitroreductase
MNVSLDATIVVYSTLVLGSGAWLYHQTRLGRSKKRNESDAKAASSNAKQANDANVDDLSLLPCIRNRRSIFPKQYLRNPPPLDDAIIQSLLDAALWAPFHGKCFAGCQHPAKFVVLGKQSMVEMQELTLRYYDQNWKNVGWGSGKNESIREDEYRAWRNRTEEEITGRWAPCSCMIAIIMRRQTGPKRLPEWEEAAAVAAAVQNMHLQSTKFPQLACYWSSWHDAARDSPEMKEFLHMSPEDRCFGFFIVAHAKQSGFKDRRQRDRSLMAVEWRR